MKLTTEISSHNVEEIVTRPDAPLDAEYALYVKIRNIYRNVKGPNYRKLCKFIVHRYETLDVIFVNISEQIRSPGYFALGSRKES